jgi:hypothetical protein
MLTHYVDSSYLLAICLSSCGIDTTIALAWNSGPGAGDFKTVNLKTQIPTC